MEWLMSLAFLTLGATGLSAQCLQGDCYDGKGTYKYPSGATYVGTFIKGKINGIGTLYSKNGNKYHGQWKDHYKSGQGKLTYANGDVYTGSFQKSKFQGKGLMAFVNGDRYEGDWHADQMHGQGIYDFHNGDKYQGAFQKGKIEGYGTMFYKSGSIYEGEWRDNQKEGKGKYTKYDGRSIQGEWYAGELVNSRSHTAQSTANRPVHNQVGQRQDRGEFTYRDGSRWVGELRNGKPWGEGILYYANGDRYEGGWAKHAPHGRGVMYYPSGQAFGAEWVYGVPKQRIDAGQSFRDDTPIAVDRDSDVKVWAVVIGVARYTHMPVLKYTDDDAYQIYAFLKSPEGGALPDQQISVLVDDLATRENILKAMRSTFLKADENDMVLMYFSGHGLPGSFLPFDFDGYNNKLMHKEIQEVLGESRARHKICFADACHSGTMLAARGASAQQTIASFYSAFDQSRGGTALLLSSKGDEYSLEDMGLRQGIYSHFLIKGLKGQADTDRNRIVTVSELFDYVHREVTRYTNHVQTPTISGKFDPNMPVAAIR